MTDRQLHQENERQGRYTANVATNTTSNAYKTAVTNPAMYPEQRKFRFVPAAVLCAFIVVGALAFYNYRQTNHAPRQTSESELSPVAESIIASSTPTNTNVGQRLTDAGETAGSNEAVAGETVTLPADAKINIVSGDQSVTIPASRLVNADGSTASVINININPVAQTPKTNAVQAAAPVVKTVQTVQTVPQVIQVPANYNYNYVPGTYYYNNYSYGNNNKPFTPYIETCGNADGDRFNDAKIVLPKFSRDGKDAVEYEVNVGTSNGGSDVHSHRYEQRDRVVFGIGIDNEKEYFVRYRVRMEGGDFGDWSDTFRFVCHRY